MRKQVRKHQLSANELIQPSQLTIVDLSCPCISPDTACSLFNVCFGIFMEQDTEIGRVVALDEAHKVRAYSTSSRLLLLIDSTVYERLG